MFKFLKRINELEEQLKKISYLVELQQWELKTCQNKIEFFENDLKRAKSDRDDTFKEIYSKLYDKQTITYHNRPPSDIDDHEFEYSMWMDFSTNSLYVFHMYQNKWIKIIGATA